MLFSLKKEGNSDMATPRMTLADRMPSERSSTKGQELYDSAYVRHLVLSPSWRQEVEWRLPETVGGE